MKNTYLKQTVPPASTGHGTGNAVRKLTAAKRWKEKYTKMREKKSSGTKTTRYKIRIK